MAAYNTTARPRIRANFSETQRVQRAAEGGSLLFQKEDENLSELKTDLSEFIAENFGANATYVETLLARWRTDPSLVDESWCTYFEELLGDSTANKAPDNGRAVTLPQADGGGAAAAKSDGHKDGAAVASAVAPQSSGAKP